MYKKAAYNVVVVCENDMKHQKTLQFI